MMTKGYKLIALLTLVWALVVPDVARAVINPMINYQGRLTDSSGVAVTNGSYNMRFRLYTSASGGSPVFTETLTGNNRVPVISGLFSVMVGSTTDITSVDFDQTLYLGVEVGGTDSVTPTWDGEMSPRKIIGSVPTAFVAKNLNGGSATTTNLYVSGSSTLQAFTATNSTTTQATTTNLFSTTASSTNLFSTSGNIGALTAGAITSGLINSQTISSTANFTGTLTATGGLTTLSNLLLTGSTTLQNFTGVNSTTTNATSTTFAVTTLCLTGDTCRTTWPTGGSGGANSKWATSTDDTSIYPNGAWRVGIGTTTPRWLLQLATSTAPQLTLSDGSLTSNHWSFRNAGGNLYLATSSPSTLATTSTSALSVLGSSGFVGIGSSSPTYKLVVDQGVVDNNSSSYGLSIFADATGNIGYSGINLSLNNSTQNVDGYLRAARTSGSLFVGYELGVNSSDGFRILTGNGSVSERLRVNSLGSVGINTDGPDRRLDVLDATNPQLRLTYADGTVYTDFLTNSSGNLTISPSGGVTSLSQFLATSSSTLQAFTFTNATGTQATTTSFFSTTASSTNLFSTSGNIGSLYGAGLNTCNTSADKLLWAGGLFSCGTDQNTGGAGSELNWTFFNNSGLRLGTSTNQVLISASGATATTSLAKLEVRYDSAAGGSLLVTGSSTLQAFTFTNATGTQATTTNLFSTTGTFATLCLTGDTCRTTWPTGGSGGANSKWATSTDDTSIYPNGAWRVGIGTTTPRWLLQLATSTAPQLTLSDGSLTSNHWSFRNAGGNLYLATSSPSTFATSTITAFSIDGSGNVGIGTTTQARRLTIANTGTGESIPAQLRLAANSHYLDIRVDEAISGNQTQIQFNFGTPDGSYVFNSGSVYTGGSLYSTAGNLYLGSQFGNSVSTDSNDKLMFSTATMGEAGRFWFNRFGIGTTTPRWLLQLATSTAPQLTLSDASLTSNHWSFRNIGGNFYLATSSPSTFATSTASALTINTNGAVSLSNNLTTAGAATFGGVVNINSGGLNVNSGNTVTGNIFVSDLTVQGSTIAFGTDGSASFPELAYSGNSLILRKADGTNGASLGIGTSTPKWLLQLATSTAPQLTLSDASLTSDHWSFRNIGGNFYLATSSPSTFATSTVTALTINTSGFVGISNSTPTEKLHIGSNTGTEGIVLAGSNANANSGYIDFRETSGAIWAGFRINHDSSANSLSIHGMDSGAVLSTPYTFYRGTGYSQLAANVAIGITPGANYALEVNGTASTTNFYTLNSTTTSATTTSFYSTNTRVADLVIVNTSNPTNMRLNTTGSYPTLDFRSGDSVSGAIGQDMLGNNDIIYRNYYGDLNSGGHQFVVRDNAFGSINAMRIVGQTGNVGIGTTTPRWALQIASSTGAQLTLSDSSSITTNHWSFRNAGGLLYLATSSASTFATNTQPMLTFNTSGGVGIRTASPLSSSALNIAVNADSSTSANGILMFGTTALSSPSANGTFVGLNAASAFSGNFVDYQLNSTRNFSIDYTGTITTLGGVASELDGDTLGIYSPSGGTVTVGNTGDTGASHLVLQAGSGGAGSNLDFVTNASTRARMNASGFGIGTTTPRWLLQLATSTAPQLTLSDASLTSNHWSFRNIGGNLYLATSSPTTFATSTVAALNIDGATSNVTIPYLTSTTICLSGDTCRTTWPTGGGGAYPFALSGNATSTLTQFNGGLTAYASSTISALTVTNGTTTNATSTNLAVSNDITVSNKLNIGQTSFGDFNIVTSAGTMWLQRSSDNTPGADLSFVKTRGTPSSPSAINVGDDSGSFNFRVHDGNNALSSIASFGAVSSTAVNPGSVSGYLYFSTTDSSNAPVEKMRITSLGEVGIGTPGPDRRLDVLDATNPQLRLTYTDGSVYTDFMSNSVGQLSIVPTSGQTGFGTTTPRWLLQLATSTAPQLTISDPTAGANHWSFRNAGGNLYLATSSPTTFATSTAPALTIDNNGFIGIGTTTPGAKLNVIGALCVDDSTPTCGNAARTEGTIYSVAALSASLDLAESYPTKDSTLSAGELVMLDAGNEMFISRAVNGSSLPIVGIVSTNPGFWLGGFNDEVFKDEIKLPIALSGRVPTKVNNEGGFINIGDRIALSSVAGVGKKATSTDQTVGIALQDMYEGQGVIEVFVDLGAPEKSTYVEALESRVSALELSLANTALTISTSTDNSIWFVASVLEAIGATISDGILFIKNLVVEKLTVGKPEAPTGITLYDSVTGAPYCLFITNGTPVSDPGECGTQGGNSDSNNVNNPPDTSTVGPSEETPEPQDTPVEEEPDVNESEVVSTEPSETEAQIDITSNTEVELPTELPQDTQVEVVTDITENEVIPEGV